MCVGNVGKMKLPAASGGISSVSRRRSCELWRAKLRRSQPVFAITSLDTVHIAIMLGRLVPSSCGVVALRRSPKLEEHGREARAL